MFINFNNPSNKGEFVIKSKVLGKDFLLNCSPPFYRIKEKNNSIILEGDLYYFYDGKKTEYLSNRSEKFIIDFLTKIIKKKGFDYCRKHLEGEYTMVIFNEKHFQLRADNLKRREIFYTQSKERFVASSELSELIKMMDKLEYDQKVISLILSSHYQYSPSRNTIYKNICALGPNEYIKYSAAGFENGTNLKFKNVENYTEDKLIEYSEILNRAILGRSDNSLNIANSTGGWDTTFIITTLVGLLGRKKVVTSTFNHVLRNKKKWNVYEKARAKKIAKHFNVKFIEVPIDFSSPSLVNCTTEFLPLLRSRNAYVGALPHFLLYKQAKKRLSGHNSGTVFTGEAADSLHNFGFSQYVPFFHESYPFKEYGDKTKNYLYSPEFFRKVKLNTYKDDMAFKVWKNIAGNLDECNYGSKNKNETLFRYLSPILFGQFRIPFERILPTKNLTKAGRNNLTAFLFNQYFLDTIHGINENNFYSCVLNMYKNFHLQGPTMKMIGIAAKHNGFKTAMPFLDVNVVDFLEKMPMSWGRGLEWNHTKYPLKEICAKNKNFPVDIVESGIHSYPSEVDPKLTDETYNFYFNSTVTDYFKEILRTKKYKEILNGEYFDLKFINEQVGLFLAGKMEKVTDYYSLIRLINFVSIGWY